MPEILIVLAVVLAVAGLAFWAVRAFAPEIARAKRIRRANRAGQIER